MKINEKQLRNIIREAIEGVADQENTNGTLEPFASIYKNMYSQESVNEFNQLLFENFPVVNQSGSICYKYRQDNGAYVYLVDDRDEQFRYDLTDDDWWWYRKIEGEYRSFNKWVPVQRHQSYFPMFANANSAKALSSLILYLNPNSSIANANYCMQQDTNINETKLREIIRRVLNEISFKTVNNASIEALYQSDLLRKNGKNKEADKKYQQSVRLGKGENDYFDKEVRERGIHAVRKDANDNWTNARKKYEP